MIGNAWSGLGRLGKAWEGWGRLGKAEVCKARHGNDEEWLENVGRPKIKIGTIKDSAVKLFEAINKKREVDLDRFLFSLGIRHLGLSSANLIANYYKSIGYYDVKVISEIVELKDDFQAEITFNINAGN